MGRLALTRGRAALMRFNDIECGRLTILQHGQKGRAAAIDSDDIRLRQVSARESGLHLSSAPRRRWLPESAAHSSLLRSGDCCSGATVVLTVSHFRRPGRQNQVLSGDGVGNVGGGKMLGIKLARVKVHHDLGLLAAIRRWDRGALHRGQLRFDEIKPKVIQLLFTQTFSGKSQLKDRNR